MSAGKILIFIFFDARGMLCVFKEVKQCTMSKIDRKMEKLEELCFEYLPCSPYSSHLTPRAYYVFTDVKNMCQGKKFGSNKKVIVETEDK